MEEGKVNVLEWLQAGLGSTRSSDEEGGHDDFKIISGKKNQTDSVDTTAVELSLFSKQDGDDSFSSIDASEQTTAEAAQQQKPKAATMIEETNEPGTTTTAPPLEKHDSSSTSDEPLEEDARGQALTKAARIRRKKLHARLQQEEDAAAAKQAASKTDPAKDSTSKIDPAEDSSLLAGEDAPPLKHNELFSESSLEILKKCEDALKNLDDKGSSEDMSLTAFSEGELVKLKKQETNDDEGRPKLARSYSSPKVIALRSTVREKEDTLREQIQREESQRSLGLKKVPRDDEEEDDDDYCSSSGEEEPPPQTRAVIRRASVGAGIGNNSGHRRRSIGVQRAHSGDLDGSSNHSFHSQGSRRNLKAPGHTMLTRQRSRRMERENSSRRLRREKQRVAATVRESHSSKVHLPTSMRQAVLESWKAAEGNLEALGMEFFLTLFEKHPQMKDLFSFGGLATADLHKSKLLQAHATGVMKTVGVALAGLEDMESLIPVLRNLGRIHTLVGVQPAHYDVIYGILIDTIAKYVGKDKWTSETEEAWELSYAAIVAVMKDPSRHLDVEPAEGWGLWNAIVCGYLAVVTPLQLANYGRIWIWQFIFYTFNMVAISTFVLDLVSDFLQRSVQLKTRDAAAQQGIRTWFFVQFRFNRIVRRLGLSRWAAWPTLDMSVLLSFVLQYSLDLYGWHLVPRGLYYLVGLVRVLSVVRLVHFVRCAELVSLKSSDISMAQFHYGQLAQLLLVLGYMIHLFGCLHCLVSKLSNRGLASAFSPALPSLLQSGEMLNAYLHTTYWAFVNVAGIGSYDSTPETSLEILFSMLVHLVGATLYTSAAGTIFSILEDRAREFGKVREGVASLKDFMQDCNIPPTSQETFVSGYLMKNFISKGTTRSKDTDETRPLLPDSAEELPSHLTEELTVFSRAKAIRNRGIKTASVEFSFVVAESLTEKLTLLPGDYLFQEGELVTRRVWMVDKGVLEIFMDGVSKKCLYPGDIIGLGWLATSQADSWESARRKAYLDWVSFDGMAIADVRAMDACRLVVGMASASQLKDLKRLYPHDINLININCMRVNEKEDGWEDKINAERPRSK